MSRAAAPVARVRWQPWRIPLRAPIATAAGTIAAREGVAVLVETADGHAAAGECAPLPGEGMDIAAVLARLDAIAPQVAGRSPEDARVMLTGCDAGAPSADVGLETALAGLLAQSRGLPLAAWLAMEAGLPPSDAPVPVNALIAAADAGEAAREASAAAARGFATFKLKVGWDIARDGERLRAVRAAIGRDAAIRIDANGVWGEAEALDALAAHAAHGVALCEQPVAPGLDAAARLARVRQRSPVPIAADESCVTPADLRALVAAGAVDAVVVKPLRTGLAGALAMIAEARAHDLPCILTTTFDSGLGTALALQLAALAPEPRPACGLATLELLEGDIATGCPVPKDGAMAVPDAPGLGVELDGAALDRYALAPWAEAVA